MPRNLVIHYLLLLLLTGAAFPTLTSRETPGAHPKIQWSRVDPAIYLALPSGGSFLVLLGVWQHRGPCRGHTSPRCTLLLVSSIPHTAPPPPPPRNFGLRSFFLDSGRHPRRGSPAFGTLPLRLPAGVCLVIAVVVGLGLVGAPTPLQP